MIHFFLLLLILFNHFPILNQYRLLLLLSLPIIILTPGCWTAGSTLSIREPTATTFFGRALVMRCLGPPSHHFHLQKPLLLVLHQLLKLLLHLNLVAQLLRDLWVGEKRGPHHLAHLGVRGIWLICLHHYLVVFEGTGLQLCYVNFPCFGALCARVWLLRLAPAVPGEYARLREHFMRVRITRQHQLSDLVVDVHLFFNLIDVRGFLRGRENAKEHGFDSWFTHVLSFWIRARQVLHVNWWLL